MLDNQWQRMNNICILVLTVHKILLPPAIYSVKEIWRNIRFTMFKGLAFLVHSTNSKIKECEK